MILFIFIELTYFCNDTELNCPSLPYHWFINIWYYSLEKREAKECCIWDKRHMFCGNFSRLVMCSAHYWQVGKCAVVCLVFFKGQVNQAFLKTANWNLLSRVILCEIYVNITNCLVIRKSKVDLHSSRCTEWATLVVNLQWYLFDSDW